MAAHIGGKKPLSICVYVCLGSFLLSESLCKTIVRELKGYKALPLTEINSVTNLTPDIILVDFPGLSHGIFSKWPDSKVLLVDTGLSECETVQVMRAHRLWGVISREIDFRQLEKALSVVLDGQIWIDNEKLKAILHGKIANSSGEMVDRLSKKEEKIIDLVAEGYKNKEIAAMLFLSEQTVKSHLGRIFKKMNITNRSQLVSLTIKNRILNQQDTSNHRSLHGSTINSVNKLSVT